MGRSLEIIDAYTSERIEICPENRSVFIGTKIYKSGSRPGFFNSKTMKKDADYEPSAAIYLSRDNYCLVAFENNLKGTGVCIFKDGSTSLRECNPREIININDFLKNTINATILLREYKFNLRHLYTDNIVELNKWV